MAKILQPEPKDMQKLEHPPNLPDEILNAFRSFEVEWIPFEVYPIRITYKMYGNPRKNPNDSYDPIYVRDIPFEEQVPKREMVSEFLDEYHDIYL
jgi:hypothetical protein